MVKNFFKHAIFLDRDGVLNQCTVVNGKPFAPRSLKEFSILPYTKLAIDRLRKKNFILIVVTNQPDIGNGIVKMSELELMHNQLRKELPLDDIRVCPHRQNEGCYCRKPKSGLLIQAGLDFKVDMKSSWMVGDRWTDIAAGQAAKTRTIFIDRSYNEKLPKMFSPDFTVSNLLEASDLIISNS